MGAAIIVTDVNRCGGGLGFGSEMVYSISCSFQPTPHKTRKLVRTDIEIPYDAVQQADCVSPRAECMGHRSILGKIGPLS